MYFIWSECRFSFIKICVCSSHSFKFSKERWPYTCLQHRFWTLANKPETEMGVKVFCLSVQQLSVAQTTGSSNWHGWTASENESWQTAHGSQRNAASTDKIVHKLGHAPLDSVRWCLLCRISRWNQFIHRFSWTIPLLKRVSCAWWIAILSKWGICHCNVYWFNLVMWYSFGYWS